MRRSKALVTAQERPQSSGRQRLVAAAVQQWMSTQLTLRLAAVGRLLMSELTPLVGGHHGAFFLMDPDGGEPALRLTSTYAYRERKGLSNRFRLGESLVGGLTRHPEWMPGSLLESLVTGSSPGKP